MFRGPESRGFATNLRKWKTTPTGRKVGLLMVGTGLLAIILIAFGLSTQTPTSGNDTGSRNQREASFRFCRAQASGLPQGMTLRERKLRNLGNNVMGQTATYADGKRRVQVHIGVDALGQAEDLDFTPRGEQRRKGRTFEVFQSAGLPAIFAAYSEESGLSPPCNTLTIFTTNLSEEELLSVLGTITVNR